MDKDELTDPRSARRIASASDQRRRFMERAMHDGVQQHLAIAVLKVSLLRQQLRVDADAADVLCQELVETLASAQRELRELAHWVYPAVLENEGLVAALSDAISRQRARIELHADGVGRHPREIETVVYFCCLEVLENVERHAGADRAAATMTLREGPGFLEFSLADGGPGFDPGAVPRGGLQHVADRLLAIGGHFDVISAPGQGTTVRGTVPLEQE